MHTPRNISRAVLHSFCCTLVAHAALKSSTAFAAQEILSCQIKVFPADPDTKGSNIRNGPGSEYKVLAMIKDSDSEIEVSGSAGKWLRIRQVTGVNGTVYFKGEGWVYGPLTGINSRGKINLLTSPDKQSAITGKMPDDATASVQGCKDAWLEIQYKNIKGWMPPNSYCGNPVTTCS
ncbi:SH3 domain-containing protein [Undibacterium sp. Ji49W]|uniref:SH3 domain-containing protein n=1 Tax=Undibacterium sp. Ji49W TaxID=3413040 RepID=UPI003BEF5E7B